jgi:hypothetical protein
LESIHRCVLAFLLNSKESLINSECLRIIPPLSVVKVTSADPEWGRLLGLEFRIGYYRESDGLDCVWLVDETGDYCRTADQEMILEHFDVLHLSEEKDVFGINRPEIGPLTGGSQIIREESN